MMGGGNGGCQWLVVVVGGNSLWLQWVAVVVRPGTTATYHMLSLIPITINPPTSSTTATTYYDDWQQWGVSVVGGGGVGGRQLIAPVGGSCGWCW